VWILSLATRPRMASPGTTSGTCSRTTVATSGSPPGFPDGNHSPAGSEPRRLSNDMDPMTAFHRRVPCGVLRRMTPAPSGSASGTGDWLGSARVDSSISRREPNCRQVPATTWSSTVGAGSGLEGGRSSTPGIQRLQIRASRRSQRQTAVRSRQWRSSRMQAAGSTRGRPQELCALIQGTATSAARDRRCIHRPAGGDPS
jgi:hypothetical protein